jgi:hypothetical protein
MNVVILIVFQFIRNVIKGIIVIMKSLLQSTTLIKFQSFFLNSISSFVDESIVIFSAWI